MKIGRIGCLAIAQWLCLQSVMNIRIPIPVQLHILLAGSGVYRYSIVMGMDWSTAVTIIVMIRHWIYCRTIWIPSLWQTLTSFALKLDEDVSSGIKMW